MPLYRGIFYIPKEVWKEYKQRHEEAKENKKITFEIFRESKLVRLAPYVLIDLDNTEKEDIKRLVKYLHKLGIYPEVWRSASGKGYHVYIFLIYRIVKVPIKNEKGKKVDKKKYYELPYASDWRIEEIVKALKELLEYLNIPYDSVSAKRSVWLEGFPNPIKDGNSSEKVFEGAVHRIDKVYQRLLPIIERVEKIRITKKFVRKYIRKNGGVNVSKGTTVGIQMEGTDSSNPKDYIQVNLENGNINRLLNAGYSLDSVGEILKENYQGDKKAFERAWRSAEKYIEDNHIPLSEKLRRKKQNGERKKKRKHKHYWEHIPVIAKCLKERITSINGIHRKTGISKGTLSYIFRIVSKEQILESPEEAMNFLKSIQKGGDKLSEKTREKAKERGKERFRRYIEEELKKVLVPKRKEKKYCLLRRKEIVPEPLKVQLEVNLGDKNSKCSNRSNIYYSLLENGRVEDGKNCLIDPLQKYKGVFNNITDESSVCKNKIDDGKTKKTLELSILDIRKEKEFKKKERTKRLIKSRQVYAETWKTFKIVKNHLENQGIEVIDSRYEKSGTGLDGRKLLKLIRYLLTNEVKELNLAGWGRYAKPLKGALIEADLIDEGTKVIMPKPKDAEELELEVLERLGFSKEAILEYQSLSEEGKLEYLEQKGKLEEYRYLMAKDGIRKEEEFERKEEWGGEEEKSLDEEIIF